MAKVGTAKPTIFFSHSSGDKDILSRLREKFLEKTGSAIEIFLSSDGQSIKLGRNWVHEIELALSRAKLMFVFLTPKSSQSQWVHFESGHAYARDIRVIPIGFNGVDLEVIRPPLSLLQGFNIVGPEGLNNLIAVLNNAFDLKFPESFGNKEFEEIMGSDQEGNLGLGITTSYVDEIRIGVPCEYKAGTEAVKAAIESHRFQVRMGESSFETHGMCVVGHNGKTGGDTGLVFKLDPRLMARNIGVVDDALGFLKIEAATVQVFVTLIEGIVEDDKFTRVSSRLFGEGVELAEDDKLSFRGIVFRVDHYIHAGATFIKSEMQRGPAYITCTYNKGRLAEMPLGGLLEVLFRQEVLRKS